MRAAWATPNASSVSAAWRMVDQSDWLPMMMATGGSPAMGCVRCHVVSLAKPEYTGRPDRSKRRSGSIRVRQSLERVVLVEPGLRQHLVAQPQEAAHLHRVGAGHRQVELGSPMAGDAVGHSLGKDIGELAARGGEDRLRLDAERNVLQRAAEELDHEL